MDFNNKLNRFCQKYAVKYYTTGRHVRHGVRTPFYPSGLAIEYQHAFKYDEEPIVALEMPESAARSLVEFCEQMENNTTTSTSFTCLSNKRKMLKCVTAIVASVKHMNATRFCWS